MAADPKELSPTECHLEIHVSKQPQPTLGSAHGDFVHHSRFIESGILDPGCAVESNHCRMVGPIVSELSCHLCHTATNEGM